MKPSYLAQFLDRTIRDRAPVLITGAPGVGKSDVVSQAAEAAGARLIIEHPAVADPTDFKGLPFATNERQADFLPFGSLAEMIAATEPTVVFLDDLGQAPPAVQAACMQLLLARRINGHRVSDAVTFIAATNRRTDRAGVAGLLEPVKSRFAAIVNLDVDVEDWVRWALSHDVPTEMISFIRFRPALLHAPVPTADLTNSPSPRTVANCARMFALNLPGEIQYEVFAGAAGEGFAAEFLAFVKVFRSLPRPDAILLDPDAAPVPTDPATLYAIAGALAARASEQTIERLVRYFNRLPAEFSVLAVRDSVHKCPAVVDSRAFVEWASAHAEVLV